jgi:hypothetical protein
MTDSPKKLVVDIAKGTQEYIDLTPAEIQQMELDAIEHATNETERKADEQRVADLRASAKAKLIAGDPLTEDEAAVLII